MGVNWLSWFGKIQVSSLSQFLFKGQNGMAEGLEFEILFIVTFSATLRLNFDKPVLNGV